MILYVRYGTVRVSRRWRTVLQAADRAHVRFHVDSGHRTMREQARLFRQNMIRPGVPKPGRPMTAFPAPNAPHIRVGQANHALDVNELDDGAHRLAFWLRTHGAHPTFPIPGENWHLELSRRDLRRLARKLA